MKILATAILCLIYNMMLLQSQNPIELGEVKWLRDINLATEISKQSGKPIFILFQEIPGCITCQRYGAEVLSHPLIVESIEHEFVPLAIHNNKGGEDARVLKQFGEPSWNNPVVRIVDADHKDIVPRLDGNYSPSGILEKMIQTLHAKKKNVPGYLVLAGEYTRMHQSLQLSFGMFCFWEGEKNLGQINGVLGTEPGFIQGQEVVKVNFDPSVLKPEELIRLARKQECAKSIFAEERNLPAFQKISEELKKSSGFRPDLEPQYYLRHTGYKYVPMLPIQASRLNSALAQGKEPSLILSPKQIVFFRFFQSHTSRGDAEAYRTTDFIKSWKKCSETLKKV